MKINKQITRALLSVFGILASLVVPGNSSAQQRVDTLWQILLHKPREIMVAAHRGSHLEHPENSIASFVAAVEQGVHIIELDVRQSKDGELVVVHDRTVDRTTTGTGNVNELTLSELKTLRLLHDGQPTDQQIPTLREALSAVRGQVLFDLDFKVGEEEAARACYQLVEELGMEKEVLFFLYDSKLLSLCLDWNPDIPVMPRARSAEEVAAIMQEPRVKVIHIDDSFYDDALVASMRERGIRVWANSLGELDRHAEQEGGDYSEFVKRMPLVNIIQTDRPVMLIDYLRSTR